MRGRSLTMEPSVVWADDDARLCGIASLTATVSLMTPPATTILHHVPLPTIRPDA
jgi:hypothetical protein